MPTTRTVRTTVTGPVRLRSNLPHHDIRVIVEDRTDGEITISTPQDSGSVADFVNSATLEGVGDQLTVRFPAGGGGGGMVITGDVVGMQINHVGGGSVFNAGVISSGNGNVIVGNNYGGIVAGVVHGDAVFVAGGRRSAGVAVGGVTMGAPIEVVARVPHGSSIDSRSIGGSIEAEGGALANVQAETTGGDVVIAEAATIRAKTIGGSIRVDKVTGRADLETIGGNIDVYGDEDVRVNARTVGGNITHSRDLDISTRSVGGSIRGVKR